MKDLLKVLVFGGLFLVPFLPVYVETDFFFPFITGKNFAFRIIIEIVFASWILLALFDEKYRPRFSWILSGFALLLGVMAIANLLGEYPLKSFWSNFERMDGYITLVHLFMYVVVMGSVMTTQKLWSYFFHLSAAVALYVALYGLAQFSGMIEGGRARVDSLLGNSAYMAVYMLFHIFIVGWLFVKTKLTVPRVMYAVIAVIFAYTLLQTGTRGTFLGFVGGIVTAVAYIAIFGRQFPEFRKIAIGACAFLVFAIGGFLAVKDSEFIQSQGPLKRIANIDLTEDLKVRATIWGMAAEGVKERPILGWGQGNFNYVFNQNFEPSLYNAEAWFDRTHNIFLDWLIAGGVLGFLAYFSIMIAALYYLLWEPLFNRESQTFDVMERAVLIGLIVGYLMHNLVVFDNIISYIFYGTILALIHSRVSQSIQSVQAYVMDNRMIVHFATPIVILITGASVYFLNVPGISASADIIDAMREDTITERLAEFHSALDRGSFANQEIVEQLVQQAMNILRNTNISEEERQAIRQRSELELLKLIEEKPGDARLHNFLATFYRSIGAVPQAQEQAAIARSLSPEKQAIILEQGITEIQANDLEQASEFFKTAFELDTGNVQALILYATTLVNLDKVAEAKALLGEEYLDEFAANDYALASVNQSGDKEFLAELFEIRIVSRPQVAQDRASLAFIYYELGDIESSVATLETAAEAIPDFSERAQCFITNLEAGNQPDEGC